EESIAFYYREKLTALSSYLSCCESCGQAKIIVLIPTNEVFSVGYENLGIYKQSEDERTEIVKQTVDGLREKFESARLPAWVNLTVTTWSEYLKSLGLEDQNEYTEKGTNLLKTSPKLNSILSEILRSSRARFMRKGIQLDDET